MRLEETRLKRIVATGLISVLASGVVGCEEELPTATEGDFIPVSAETFEVRLPFSEFAENLRTVGGYGTPSDLGNSFLARNYKGSLESRTLARFWWYPTVVSVRDTTGTTRPDSSLTYVGGRVIAHFDTLGSVHEGPVTVAAGAIQTPWHPPSASWRYAVDSIGDQQAWPEAGVGPVTPVGTAVWDPSAGDSLQVDSVVIEVDSATVIAWNDTTDVSRGVRLVAETDGVRLKVTRVTIRLDARPSSNPDTIIELVSGAQYLTFAYDPEPLPPENSIRVGGVPAWRTIFDMNLPEALDGPEELCAKVGCPLELSPEMINAASIVFRTEAPEPAFVPTDTLLLDVRPVLQPSRLPKSPLGSPLAGAFGVTLPPDLFQEGAGQTWDLPLGGYIVDLIRGETLFGNPVPRTLALLSLFEPLSLQYAAFKGPDSPEGPELRLILTVGQGVQIR